MNLYPHQKDGIDFLIKTKKAILGDDMGLGKTRQAIIASGTVSKKDILVICPASLKLNWKREIQSVYTEDKVFIYGSDDKQELDTTWYIINYDILGKKMLELELKQFETVILDESHYIKGNSQRATNAIKICKQAKNVYLLSGTVVQNRPIELFNQLKAIDHPLTHSGSSWISFGYRYCAGFKMAYGSGPMFYDFRGASNLGELWQKVKPYYLRRRKKDVLDLPEKTKSTITVGISKEWRAKYETAFDDYIKWLQDNPEILEEKNLANIFMVQHLVELSKVKAVASMAKVDTVVEYAKNILETGEKVVIFTTYQATLEAIKSELGRAYKKVEITGSTKLNKRQEAVDQFQNDPKTKVFIGNIEASGVGITLTASTNVIFADLDWNPANHDQAEDRCHRIGQTGTVNVYYFVAEDTVDEDIMDMLEKKREVVQAILEGKQMDTKSRAMAKQLIHSITQRGRVINR